MLVLAHVSHYLWVLYLPPILVVVASIVRTTIKERKLRKKDASASPAGGAVGEGPRTTPPAAPLPHRDRTRGRGVGPS